MRALNLHCDWEDCDYWSSYEYFYGLKLVENEWRSPDGEIPKHNHWISMDDVEFPLADGGIGDCGRVYALKKDRNDARTFHSDCNQQLYSICEFPVSQWNKFWC